MNHTKHDYQRAFEKFKSLNPDVWHRYETPAAAELLLVHFVQEQQPPSQITVELGIKRFLVRVDGGDHSADVQKELAKITDRISAPELSRAEIDFFQSLSARELAQRYWVDGGVNELAIRLNKAVKEKPFGLIFAIPGRPASLDDDVEAVELSAAEYHATPANRIIQRLKSDRGYRLAVDKLIAEGKI
jgi:hypothetical protein